MIGTAGLPHVIIRFFTVPKVKDARLSAGWALVFIAILYTTAPSVASMARLNLTNTIQSGPIGEADGNLKYEDRPQWFKNWETTGLLRHNDKNKDGRIQYYNTSNKEFASVAENAGWRGNELEHIPFGKEAKDAKAGPDNDIIVLANPEIANLPNWVIALVVAGGLAAALSTAAGLLLAISSAISHDLLKGVFKPDISEKDELKAGRISMIGAIVVAGYFGLNPPDFAAGTVAIAFGLAASSIFPVLMMGIFYKRMNRAGAISGMVAGIGVTMLYVFQHKGIMFIPGTAFLGDMPENWFLGITPNAFGAVGALVNFLVAFIVSNRTAPPPVEVQQLVENIRIPKGSAGPATDH